MMDALLLSVLVTIASLGTAADAASGHVIRRSRAGTRFMDLKPDGRREVSCQQKSM